MNVSARAGMALALLAAAPATTILILQCVLGNTWVFNDFHAYWLAARLVARGQSPYDFAAFTDLARSSGIPSVVGMGYSYPPFFAVVMVPLASLPFDIAARVFAGGSALVLGVTIAGLLRAAPALASTTWRRTAASALAMGLYPPIISSLVMGQVNLFVLALVAFGMLGGHSLPRMIAAGVALGVAAGVKMVPIVLLFPLLLARRSVIALSMLGAIVATVVFSSLAAPEAMRGTESLGGLFDADPYWTNQSLNGFGSRLFLEGDRTHCPCRRQPRLDFRGQPRPRRRAGSGDWLGLVERSSRTGQTARARGRSRLCTGRRDRGRTQDVVQQSRTGAARRLDAARSPSC